VYVICVVIVLRRSKNEAGEPWDKIWLLVLAGIAMFLAIASSPGWKRLATSSPPAVILLSWLLDRWGRTSTRTSALTSALTSARTMAKFRIGLGAVAIVIAVAGAVRIQTRRMAFLDLPIGKTAFVDFARYEEYRYAMGRTRRGQFMFGPSPILLALQVENPAPIDGFVPFEYTRPEQVTATIQALEGNKVPWLMLHPSMFTDPDSDPAGDHLGPLRAYLAGGYHVTMSFNTGDELWERNDDPRTVR
jgi:hypothetical protein